MTVTDDQPISDRPSIPPGPAPNRQGRISALRLRMAGTGVGARARGLRSTLADTGPGRERLQTGAAAIARRAWARIGPVLRSVTALGWTVLVIGVVSWIVGAKLGWNELLVLAATCLLAILLAVGFVVGRTALEITVELDSQRVVAGDTANGQVSFRNRTGRRLLPLRVDLPVGEAVASFDVRSIEGGGTTDEMFVVPTERRGVIGIGPASAVRGDPVGLLQRQADNGERVELLVHPRTVALPSFGTGLLRDLEGRTTKDVSVSDLAFHAIREYEPGDDRRYVHWRSTAKAGRLLVRQFLDTRRSALAVLVDGRSAGYADPEELETALRVAGSLAVRAAQDDLETVLAAGRQATSGGVRHRLLDALARAEMSPSGPDLTELAARVAARDAATTLTVLIGGSLLTSIDLQRAAARFSPEVRVVGVRVAPSERPTISPAGRVTIIGLRAVEDLPGLLSIEGAA